MLELLRIPRSKIDFVFAKLFLKQYSGIMLALTFVPGARASPMTLSEVHVGSIAVHVEYF